MVGQMIVVSSVLLSLATVSLAATDSKVPPVFADNYKVHGSLSLPYAELNEPFVAAYDKNKDKSYTSYYDGEYKVYQFGPAKGSSLNASRDDQYGQIYKIVYVPADFATHQSMSQKLWTKLRDELKSLYPAHVAAPLTKTRRVCFASGGAVGATIRAQTVLPDLSGFEYDSTGKCPQMNLEHRHSDCELWKRTATVGDKKNTYKFWLTRRVANTTVSPVIVPVHYYMLGFDSLLGSHYDRYDISYYNYQPNNAQDKDFAVDYKGQNCGPMPGPGDSNDAVSTHRAHMIVQNPIHQYVTEPHRYDHVDSHFEEFMAKHGKSYGSASDQRKGWFHFLHNLRYIHGKNRQLKNYKLAVNQYADQNARELGYLRGRFRSVGGNNGGMPYNHNNLKLNGANPLPESYDWTVFGAVTPVKDQAVCGSCWSFGTIGAIEGVNFVKTNKLLTLSQQQLVDCSWQFGNNGCDGGEDYRAYKYIMRAGGVATEEDYGHYRAIDGKCHDTETPKSVVLKGFYNVTTNSIDALKHAIVTYGPVSIGIDASKPTFTFYSHGAYSDEKCSSDPMDQDHAVLAVGYTHIDGELVWKVKNSWSTYWGNDGYIYIQAKNNICGVLDNPTVPVIA